MPRFYSCLLTRLFPVWLLLIGLSDAYSQTPTNGLIAYYPFTGNAADSAGFNRHGVTANLALTADRFGRANRAYLFDSPNDRFTVSNWGQLTGNSARSVSLWFKTSQKDGFYYFVSWGGNAPNQVCAVGNQWVSNTTNYLGLWIWDNDTAIPNLWYDNLWHHILITHDGSVTKLFIDGELKRSRTVLPYSTPASNLFLGSFLGASEYYTGTLDDVRIYNRALSESEALALYQAEAPKTVVGYTTVDVNVGGNGDANAGMSINVPKGTLIQPTLKLVYNSQRGNGLQGLGWSLDGVFQSISRLSATIAQDGFSDQVDFDESDRFALNGERLMVINGVYGANGAEYRTEQNSFSKIISYGNTGKGPEKFRVWTKDGLILDFGYNTNSRIETSGSTTEVILWLLDRMEDKKGNYLTITYEEDNAKGEFRPVQINYTGNSRTGLQPYNSVKFFYEDRPDFYSKRLNAIEAYDHSTLFRRYVLKDVILYVDECNCYLLTLLAHNWAPCDKTPVLVEQAGRIYLSLIAAIAPNVRVYLRTGATLYG